MAVIKGAYYISSDAAKFPASTVDLENFTHIYYSYVSPDDNKFVINLTEVEREKLKHFVSEIRKKKDPPVKIILSIAGKKEVLAQMASTTHNRSAFIKSCTEISRNCGFDGMDFDWEYPERQAQMIDLESLLQEWRTEIDKEYKNRQPEHRMSKLTLSAVVYYTVEFDNPPRMYPVDSIKYNLDWIHVRSYDYGKDVTSFTHAHARLYNPGNESFSTSSGLQSWISAGVPGEKVIVGFPLFGRTWKLTQKEDNGIGAPALSVGSGTKGVMSYSDIKTFNIDKENPDVFVVYDRSTVSAYSVSHENWIGFDNRDSIEEKITYARDHLGLGGYFFSHVIDDCNSELSRTASEAW